MSGGAHIDPSNKKIALIISVLALVLAISETLGKLPQVLHYKIILKHQISGLFFKLNLYV